MTSFRDGRVWLNVLQAKDGTELFTLNKSVRTDNGWRNTLFFERVFGDVDSIKRVLEKFIQSFSSSSTEDEEVSLVKEERVC